MQYGDLWRFIKMKKLLFLITILSIAVFSTACINNYAVQQLNNKAMEYMKQGDYKNAISRFKASLDLDSSFYETYYNLAVAYTEDEDYEEAIKSFDEALKLKSDAPDLYYSRAVMYENYAKDLYSGETKEQKEKKETDEDNDENAVSKSSNIDNDDFKPSEEEINKTKEYYNNAIADYEKYLEISSSSSDANDVQSKIEDIQTRIKQIEEGKDTN